MAAGSSAAAGVPAIPTVESLAGSVLSHRFGELFNPPGLTNFAGCVQAALDVTGIRSLSFPPLAQGEQSMNALGNRSDVTGLLFLDDEYLASRRDLVEFVWRPDRIERRTRAREVELASTTILPFDQSAVAVRLRVTNPGAQRRSIRIRLMVQGGVTRSRAIWQSVCPGERDNQRQVDAERGIVIFRAAHSPAYSVQGTYPRPVALDPTSLEHRLDLGPGEGKEIVFVTALGEDAETALRAYDDLSRNFGTHERAGRERWNHTLAAAFIPGNDIFSGALPVLTTADAALNRIYHTALMTVLFHRRTTPHSVYGTTYVTLGPRYWETTSFLWDISLSSILLALLDPAVLRRMIETWMMLDIHQHFGTEYLTGAGVGPWYSVNDFAMCRMAREYLRWSGDRVWLERRVGERNVRDHLITYAEHWRALDRHGHGLADYGGVRNLLECVSSYTHEVASLNAANVYCLRFAAELAEMNGEASRSRSLRDEAERLVARVLALYVPGKGYWNCRQPDGSLIPVRHCYDFGTVLTAIPDALTATQKREMVNFFRTELQTASWMRALSTRDPDVAFSIRPDHQWTGAYTAWPAIALRALYLAGESDLALQWMRGIARSTWQGPLAQAHFAETAVDPEPGGGARKAPSDLPYINDWACVSGGSFLDPILEGVFGIEADLGGRLTATPHHAGADSRAELRGLRYQGKSYSVSARGVRTA